MTFGAQLTYLVLSLLVGCGAKHLHWVFDLRGEYESVTHRGEHSFCSGAHISAKARLELTPGSSFVSQPVDQFGGDDSGDGWSLEVHPRLSAPLARLMVCWQVWAEVHQFEG